MDCVDLVSWCQMFHRKHRKTIGKQCGMMIFTDYMVILMTISGDFMGLYIKIYTHTPLF